MSYADYLENELLDHWLGGADYIRPASVFVALSSTTPTDAGGNFTEPVGNGYARPTVPNNAANWPAAVGGSKSNANEVAFPQASASWGTQTHFALFDALSGGNMLGWAILGTAKPVDTDDIPKFAAGALTVTLD